MSGSEKKVVLAMSGGVDSSVAASLLKGQGYEVTGVFMCMTVYACDGQDQADAQSADARAMAEVMDIELHVLRLGERFGAIIDYFADEYARGRTPNPCVRCNRQVKFAQLFALADEIGAAHVATGHYARIVAPSTDGAYIARARSEAKDQSYVLSQIERRYLSRILLPIGEVSDKAEVRHLARELGLAVHDKPDSQDACFVSDGDYVSVVRSKRPDAFRPGPIVDSGGQQLGTHQGCAAYTIGQRRGLGVAAGVPMYVTRIDPARATVTIGPRSEVMSCGLTAGGANWQGDVAECFEAMVQIRYNHRGAPAEVRLKGDGVFEVRFVQPVAAVTPGQVVVVYDGRRMLGGGWIDQAHAAPV